MLTFESTRPWARDIKTRVVARQMPPWFADPHYGPYSNDASLRQQDIDTIAKWADTGAHAGDEMMFPFFSVVVDKGVDPKTDQVKATGCVAKDEQGQVTLVDAAIEVEPFYGPGAAAFKAAPKPQASRTTFILKGGADLASHVGQKVAVVGKLEPGSATSGGVPTGGVQVVYVPRLAVQSITKVGTTCK